MGCSVGVGVWWGEVGSDAFVEQVVPVRRNEEHGGCLLVCTGVMQGGRGVGSGLGCLVGVVVRMGAVVGVNVWCKMVWEWLHVGICGHIVVCCWAWCG